MSPYWGVPWRRPPGNTAEIRGQGAQTGKDNTDEAEDEDSAGGGTVPDRGAEDLGGCRAGLPRPSPDPTTLRAHPPVVPGGPGSVRRLVQAVPGRGAVPRGDRRRGPAGLPGGPGREADRDEGLRYRQGGGEGEEEAEAGDDQPPGLRRQEPDRLGGPQRVPGGDPGPPAQPGDAPQGDQEPGPVPTTEADQGDRAAEGPPGQ